MTASNDKGDYSFAIFGILIAEVSPVGLVLFQCPYGHSIRRNANEDPSGIAPRHSGDSDPGQDLEKVVWERHKVEAIASWYRPLPRSGGPKGTKG